MMESWTFKVTKEDLRLLALIAQHEQRSKGDSLRRMIRAEAERIQAEMKRNAREVKARPV